MCNRCQIKYEQHMDIMAAIPLFRNTLELVGGRLSDTLAGYLGSAMRSPCPSKVLRFAQSEWDLSDHRKPRRLQPTQADEVSF